MPYFLTVYRLDNDRALIHSRTELDIPKDDALEALDSMRSALPSNFGASLNDENGNNVRPGE